MSEVIIRGSLGNLWGELNLPEGAERPPLVILSHGFGGTHAGHRDYADYFVRRGLATYNFDFCGGGPGSRSDGTMLEMSVLTEAADLNAILDRFKGDGRFGKLMLWGGSQGGFVSACVAAQRPGDVAALALEYPAFVLQEHARLRVEANGGLPETEVVLGQTIGRKYSEDALSFDVFDVIGGYGGDVLILHGDRDSVVPLACSQRAAGIYAAAELVVLPGQDHGFTGQARDGAMAREAAFLLAHA